MILWLLVKLLLLYIWTFLVSVSLYFYLNRTLLPSHRIIEFPLNWRENSLSSLSSSPSSITTAIVELERGQRVGGNFYLKSSKSNESGDVQVPDFPVIQSNVPYDISLLLKYPDRPEIADLGNLRIKMKMVRRDGSEAGSVEIVRALRYETNILRLFREMISVPGAIWRGTGSERIERINLIERLVDKSVQNERKQPHFGANQFIMKQNHPLNSNPINRLEISISPLPPLHSLHLEVLANLSPLQHFLFYWRVPTGLLVIGGCTAILWFLVSIYALIEGVKLIMNIRKRESSESTNEMIDLSEIGELEEVTESIRSTCGSEGEDEDEDEDEEIICLPFPPVDSVANFIGDLRQRKLSAKSDDDDDDDDGNGSIYESSDDVEDQNVPVIISKQFEKEL